MEFFILKVYTTRGLQSSSSITDTTNAYYHKYHNAVSPIHPKPIKSPNARNKMSNMSAFPINGMLPEPHKRLYSIPLRSKNA